MEFVKKLKAPENRKYIENLVFILMLTAVGLLMRFALFPKESGDYRAFLLPWYNKIKDNGGFAAVGMEIGDYTPMYYYILAFLTYLPISPLVGIKIVSCIADVIMAVFGYKIVYHMTGNKSKSIVAYGVLFFMPSMVINSAAWAQCDAIFTTCILAALYFLLKDEDWNAALCFSLSFVFKIQAIFFAPVLGILLLKKKIRWRTVLALPFVYIMSIIPAWIAGGNFWRLMTVYIRQSAQYPKLNLNIPNAWTIFIDAEYDELGKGGIFFAGGLVLIALYIAYRYKYVITNKMLLILSGLFTLLMPFVLPHMHERYYYLPLAITAIFSIVYIKNIWMMLVVELALFQGQLRFIYGRADFSLDMNIITLLLVAVLVWYFKSMYDIIAEQRNQAEAEGLTMDEFISAHEQAKQETVEEEAEQLDVELTDEQLSEDVSSVQEELDSEAIADEVIAESIEAGEDAANEVVNAEELTVIDEEVNDEPIESEAEESVDSVDIEELPVIDEDDITD